MFGLFSLLSQGEFVKSTLLPVHPVTGRVAVGWRKARRGETGDQPIWPILGGAPDDGEDEGGDSSDAEDEDASQMLANAVDGDGDSPDGEGEDEDKPLGPKGEKALAAEKERRRQESKLRRASDQRVAELEKELEKLRNPKPSGSDDGKDGDKPDADAIRKEIEAEYAAKAAGERVLDKIEVKAAKAFADPADAVAMLMRGRDVTDFLDNGKPDVEAIQEALDELLEKKPYLAAAQSRPKFQGKADAGAKPAKPARPRSLDEAVKRALAPK